jgi:hypothetical protein
MSIRNGLLVVLLLALTQAAWAGPSVVLKKGRICDQDGTMCLRGSLTQDDTGNVIRFDGRVARSSGPGVVSILLKGVDSKRSPCTTFFEFPIRGRASEIIQEEHIVGRPGVSNWRVLQVTFEPDDG